MSADFIKHLDALAVPMFTAPARGDDYTRPTGWQRFDHTGNAARLDCHRPGVALMGLMGGRVVVVDVDTKNGADVEKTRQALQGVGIVIYADVLTPSGGRHFYVAGHPDVPTVHATAGRDGLTGLPGVELISSGANVFLPGTTRAKYNGGGYVILEDNLEVLADGGNPDAAEALAGFVADRRVRPAAAQVEASPPWDGAPPDRRQTAYLEAAVSRQCDELAAMGPRTGRNHALYLAALKLGSFVAGAGLDEAHVIQRLTSAAEACGLTAEDGPQSVAASIGSGLRNGRCSPRTVPQAEAEISAGSASSAGPAGSDGPPLHRGIELAEDVQEDGTALLDEVRDWLGRHITVIDPTDLDVLTLWAAHTHLSTALYTTPRLQIDSPVPESGKTTVLEHLERLCFRAIIASSISSPALLARIVSIEPRTLLLDEVDRTLDPKKEGVGDLLAILNGGYKIGAKRPTLVPVKGGAWEVDELSTFAPLAMAGNQPALPDDTRSRIIRVLLYPDWTGRAEESDWENDEHHVSELGARLARWARHARDDVRPRPQMPPGCTSRFREKWQPLARVAQAAGPHWVAVVMDRAARDVADVAADRDAGLAAEKPGVLLLRHITQLWPNGEPFWGTASLVDTLTTEHPEAWGDASPYGKALTIQRMGRMLASNYGIRSTREDTAEKSSPRGYRRDMFAGAADALTSRPAAGSEHTRENRYTPSGYEASALESLPAGISAASDMSRTEPAERAEQAEPAEPCPLHPTPKPDVCFTCESGAEPVNLVESVC